MPLGVLQLFEQGFEAVEEMGELEERRVCGEDGVGIVLQLQEGLNGGGVGRIVGDGNGVGYKIFGSVFNGFQDGQHMLIMFV